MSYKGPGGYSASRFSGPNSGGARPVSREREIGVSNDEYDWRAWEEEEKAAPAPVHNPKDDWPHYCEPCDKGFYTKKRYDEHCEEHIHCPVPGCNFLCRKEYKLELHKVLLHDRNNVNLEDTAKYLAERKRRYPTMARVAEAKQIALLRQQRGEALGRNSSRQTAPQGGGKKGGGKAGGKGTKSRPPLYYKCRNCGRPGHYTEHCWNEESTGKGRTKRSRSPGDDENDKPEEQSAREPPPGMFPPTETVAASPMLEKGGETSMPPPSSEMSSRIHHASFQQQRRPRRKKPTLWEKLIQTDIQREKSMLLQCLRYFVLTDFLQKDLDWVAFVAHSTSQDLATDMESRTCAVRSVTSAPDSLQTTKRIKLEDDNQSCDSSTDDTSSSETEEESKEEVPDSNNQINDELQQAKERIRLLEEQLQRQNQKQDQSPILQEDDLQPILQDEDAYSV